MTGSGNVQIGFVSAGFMGQTAHLPNYTGVGDCEIVALAEPRTELASEVARRYGIPAVYETHEELLASADVDAVVAIQPYHRHFAIVPDILEAGYPVFTEKPIASTPTTAKRLAELADEHGVLHMVGYHKRVDPAMARAGRTIQTWREADTAGSLRYVRITMPPGDWIAGAPEPITTNEEPPEAEMEGPPAAFEEETGEAFDAFLNYYVHQINALRYLLGEPYEVTHADERLLVAEGASGVPATIELAPYETSMGWHETAVVGFDRGYVRVELPPPLASQRAGVVEELYPDGGEPIRRRPAMPPESAMLQQARRFVAAVRGEWEPAVTADEAVEDGRIASEYIQALHS